MAMNTQTQTFRGFCRAGELNAQTAVECRFGGEVETVLSVHAAATLSGAEAEDGAVRYFGKVLFSVVYEDAEKAGVPRGEGCGIFRPCAGCIRDARAHGAGAA